MANHRITTTAVRSIHKSTVGEDFFLSRVLGLRACSSSSSNKPKNNVNDRLSGVIDAVNDRKLPPELRGQRNAVRSETDIINVVEQRIWHSMEEGQFENLPGKGWRAALKNAWTCKQENEPNWIERSEVLKQRLRDINNKVFRYNLIVPFGRQMNGLNWEKELVNLHGEPAK
ncbi:hypothetical protein POM88_017742 [Heracleum sosnowskyi]|uniref:Uncharacterized protein n=1 Tax=Heracleum sosnowskyi TaxID=360622 RepID=A0AAD8IR23_9APIA|nr:hypothetical protein POM88_017742 [Heracleum sosnowskyi]